jgi:hypothetical protein
VPKPLDEVCCARLPRAALAALAPLRCTPNVTVTFAGDWLWLHWRAGDEEVLATVLPLHGVELFALRDGQWHRPEQRLPAFDVPKHGDGLSLEQVLFPAAVEPEPPPPLAIGPVTLTLVADDHPRPTTALLCELASLGRWADRAPSAELEAVRAARCGARVLLLGTALPMLAGARRLWGQRVLTPLGYRPEPALGEEMLRSAFGVQADELLLLNHDGVEVVPSDALEPLHRAAVRFSLRESAE